MEEFGRRVLSCSRAIRESDRILDEETDLRFARSEGVPLLRRMLAYEPSHRITAEGALGMTYMKGGGWTPSPTELQAGDQLTD